MGDGFEDVRERLAYFNEGVVTLHPPASDELIRRSEERLSFEFPPSMRRSLLTHNGIEIGDFRTFGVPPERLLNHRFPTIPLFDETARWFEGMTEFPGELGPPANARVKAAASRILVVAEPLPGDVYAMLIGCADERGEYPIGWVDHETNDIAVVASTYERLLWFEADDQTRQLDPDGEWLDNMNTPFMRDYEWMLRMDPELAPWITA